MQPLYQHLDEQSMEQHGNDWIPAIPLPFYTSTGLFKKPIYQCGCGARFSNENVYREHYRTEQMIEMNRAMSRTRDLAKVKALYWRRRAFVLEHGDEASVAEVKRVELPEIVDRDEAEILTARVTDVWGPVYRKWAEKNDVTVGRVKDETEVTDETPERAANDMADKFYSHTNSKGVTYILHMREVSLRGGKMTPIYYFRKEVFHKDVCAELPDHLYVRENPRNGFLTVARKELS